MNSENSIRPSCRETNMEGVSILYLLYFPQLLFCPVMMSLMHSIENGARRCAPSRGLFLPCTWFSPEAKTCHLWSLVRWMLLGCNLIYKWILNKRPQNIMRQITVSNLSHFLNEDRWIKSYEREKISHWHFHAMSFANILSDQFCWKRPSQPFKVVASSNLPTESMDKKCLLLRIVISCKLPQMQLTHRNTSYAGKRTHISNSIHKSIEKRNLWTIEHLYEIHTHPLNRTFWNSHNAPPLSLVKPLKLLSNLYLIQSNKNLICRVHEFALSNSVKCECCCVLCL